LELPVALDKLSYRKALALLERRGIVEHGRLTAYGRNVEAMPVERPWAELLVLADDDLLPFLAVMSAIESLHRMTREDRYLEGLVVPGSDHLTAYNLYADAYRLYGSIGEVYGLPRHLFDDRIDEWAERRGVLVKAIEDIALGMASVYRNLEMRLPYEMPFADDATLRSFQDLLARIMPFELVIDEMTADGEEARVSKTSVAGSWGAIAGEIRYFADRMGIPRASIEGTQIPLGLIRKYATRGPPADRSSTTGSCSSETSSPSAIVFPMTSPTSHARRSLRRPRGSRLAIGRSRNCVRASKSCVRCGVAAGDARPGLGPKSWRLSFASRYGTCGRMRNFEQHRSPSTPTIWSPLRSARDGWRFPTPSPFGTARCLSTMGSRMGWGGSRGCVYQKKWRAHSLKLSCRLSIDR
jgi:hypothetical protein